LDFLAKLPHKTRILGQFGQSSGTLPPYTAKLLTTQADTRSEYRNENVNVAMVIPEQEGGRNRNIRVQLGVFYTCIQALR
jgi:hypothetical protein